MSIENNKIDESVVLIGDASGNKFGTGFAFYTEGTSVWLLTCAHIVRNVGHELYIRDPRFEQTRVEIVAWGQDHEADLAVLKAQSLPNNSIPILKIGLGAERGIDCEVMGFSSLNEVKKERCVQPLEAKLEKPVILTQQNTEAHRITAWKLRMLQENTLEEGYSGSPVYGKQNKIVIAVISLQIGQGGEGYAISLENLPKIWAGLPHGLLSLTDSAVPRMDECSVPGYLHVPYKPTSTRHFTGREVMLHNLAVSLNQGELPAPPQAITGLAGIGKTQLAVQYAFSHHSEYAGVWWFLSETSTTLCGSFLALADRLGLPERSKKEAHVVREEVLQWLGRERQRWLLIYDNASGPQELRPYLPQAGCHHILITSCNPNWLGVAELHGLDPLSPVESVEFLLKRTGTSDSEAAKALADTLGDLPLALEQAGAYIEETSCGLLGYLELYKTRGTELLRIRGEIVNEHPDPVATTWDISFKRIKMTNPSAAELLRFCAFLQPDAIPEELITEGAAELGPILEPVAADSLKLNKAIADAQKYSLLRRNSKTKTLKIHRLVQAVLKDGMDEETKELWIKRVKLAWLRAVPSSEHPPPWLVPKRPHINPQKNTDLIRDWGKECPDGARVYDQNTTLRMQAKENIRKLLKLYGTVISLNETIMRASNRDDLFLRICRDVVKQGPVIMAWIGLLDEKTRSVVSFCQHNHEVGDLSIINISVDEMAEGRDPTGIAIREGRGEFINEFTTKKLALPWLDETLRCSVRSGAALPFRFGGKTIGAITLYVDQPNFFDSHQVQFLKAMSNDISSSLDGFELRTRPHGAQTALQNMLKKLEGSIQKAEKDRHTMSHERSVSQLAVAIAQKMGLGKMQINGIRFAGLIHDIGNISIPPEILSKSGPLTPIELDIVHSHVQEGYDFVKDINCPWPLDQIILQHHELLDGSGYPKSLRDQDILLEAKILTISDRIGACLYPRSDRPALNIDEALKQIKKYRGVRYNSDAIDACLTLRRDNRL